MISAFKNDAPKNANASGATEADAEENAESTSNVSTAENIVKHDKRLATLRARAALAGVTLCATDDDRGKPLYVASCSALTCQLDSLDSVETWLNLMTGAQEIPTNKHPSICQNGMCKSSPPQEGQ